MAFSIYYRKHLRQFAWCPGEHPLANASCASELEAVELVRRLNNSTGWQQELTLASYAVRRAA
jgi:hypothetical protein